MGSADEARAHIALAEKALSSSWLSLKFGPDQLTASMEYTQAATKFRAAGLLAESVAAWIKTAEMKEVLHDLFGAGRAYESAGAICDGSGPGGSTAAAGHWEKAIRCFRLSGKGEVAAKLLLKLAANKEKAGDVPAAKTAFDDAIEVYEQDEKDYNTADVYKQYIGFLVRSASFEDAAKAIDGHVAVLTRQKHSHFVYKELLAKVVIFLHMQDTVRAEDALNSPGDLQGWYSSNESVAGAELVAAFQAYDDEGAQRVLKDQVFSFLQVEVARLAKQLRVPTLAAPAVSPVPAVSSANSVPADATVQEPVEDAPKGGASPDDMGAMLL